MKSKTYSYGRQTISWRDVWEVAKALRSAWLTQGPTVVEFEKEICRYTGAKYAVAVANGTAALHLTTLVLNLQPQDEIITSANTFLASANCVLYVGAKAVFCDIDPETGLLDLNDLARKITDKTRAIIPVHFAGQSCDMEKIAKLKQGKNIFIIEDAAHAIGSKYHKEYVGNCCYSDMTIFSFHPVKTITTAEGGAITTNNPDLYEKLMILRSHGMTKDSKYLTHNDGPWYYEMHWLGFNYRLTDIQAALGISQMKQLEQFKKRRREIVMLYRNFFAGDERFKLLAEKEYSEAAFHLCPLLIDFSKIKITKRELFEKLKARGITLQVHYIPVPNQPFYQKLGNKPEEFPHANAYYQSEFSLPLYPVLTNKDISHIVQVIKELAS